MGYPGITLPALHCIREYLKGSGGTGRMVTGVGNMFYGGDVHNLGFLHQLIIRFALWHSESYDLESQQLPLDRHTHTLLNFDCCEVTAAGGGAPLTGWRRVGIGGVRQPEHAETTGHENMTARSRM